MASPLRICICILFVSLLLPSIAYRCRKPRQSPLATTLVGCLGAPRGMCQHDSYRPHIVTQWLHIHCFQSIEETRSHFFRNKHSICTTTVVLEWSFRPIGYSCNVHVTGQWINDSAWSQGSVRGPTANQFATQCLQYKPFAQELLQYQKSYTMQGNQIRSTTCGCRCSLPLHWHWSFQLIEVEFQNVGVKQNQWFDKNWPRTQSY